ncbi:MAG: hypothetical protein QUS33_07095 [Dehalococcoidia bacterium]|nr:hypothetical protein [Dehalococcoidia bacterium]
MRGTIGIMSTSQRPSRGPAAPVYVYTHTLSDPVLDEKRFTTSTEHILEYKGRRVLYTYTEASAISFCSASGANYAGNMNVKGYVIRWKYGTNERGELLSEIEPVMDKKAQDEITRILWPGTNSAPRVFFA